MTSGIGQKIVLMDLINASNTKQIRDMGLGAREIKDIADVLDSDGPVKLWLNVSVMVSNK